MSYQLSVIAKILNLPFEGKQEGIISQLVTDSRKVIISHETLFFALPGLRRQGTDFIEDLYHKGVRSFVVPDSYVPTLLAEDVIYFAVPDVVRALQQIAAWHRQQFNYPVIGITGSNGKTVVKEWLYQLLKQDFSIVRSPRSYNSQIGVPLSVWEMNHQHELAIFEAGISQPKEMKYLAEIIQPTISVFTHFGDAHSESFTNKLEKWQEKMQLFPANANWVFSTDFFPEHWNNLIQLPSTAFTWSKCSSAKLTVSNIQLKESNTIIQAIYEGNSVQINIPFTDQASINNAITCWSVMLLLNIPQMVIQERMLYLEPVEMRLHLRKGMHNCILINDAYNTDQGSLQVALDYLMQHRQQRRTTVILSDITAGNSDLSTIYSNVADTIAARKVDRFIAVGKDMIAHAALFLQKGLSPIFFENTDALMSAWFSLRFHDETILLKGARRFGFERLSQLLEEQVHQTVMEVNLSALAHNIKSYQKRLKPTTRVMAMVKAFSYGSGIEEIARVMEKNGVDYLAVAYADEGVALRKAGIRLPILVMSPEPTAFDALVEHGLEPEIYDLRLLQELVRYIQAQAIPTFPIHIKLDTGMHRLGFESHEMNELLQLLKEYPQLVIKSVFSHLAASEQSQHDDFTLQQQRVFEGGVLAIEEVVHYTFLKHIANTAAVQRHPSLEYDMVRLGIGLYGADVTKDAPIDLEIVATLTTTVAQVKQVAKGDTIGYGRLGVADRDMRIATIRIGYADGFGRSLGLGKGKVWIQGGLAPVVGQVCMDMTMVDVTDIPGVVAGTSVEIFGKNLPVQQVAEWANTIVYEILTGISQRVKRVYFEE